MGSALVVAVVLVAGAFVAHEAQKRLLTESVDTSLEARANDLAGALADGSLPPVLSVRDSEEGLVQVVGPGGDIVAASANVAGGPLLVGDFAPARGHAFRTVDRVPIEDEPFRVIGQRHATAEGTFTVYVGESLEGVAESGAALTRILWVAIPLLVLLVAGLTWVVVGRALSPVEAIRSEVARIRSEDLHRRVPEPALDDEIGRLARTMNEMLERLEAARERQQRFVADASHELRSPLTSIRAQLEVELARPEQARPRETAREVLAEAVRMERLVDDLLELARGDEAGAALDREPVDLDDIVFSELDRVREPERITINARGVSGAQVRADRRQLTRVVRNLLGNAARHASSSIVVTLTQDAEGATLTVADDGEGIPPGQVERVFERFTRLDDSRARDGGGAGLGLAIAREIVERHGGTIAIDPEHAPGARVVVWLPNEAPSNAAPP